MPGLIAKVKIKLLWLRHAYVYNWAHKPLCDRFHKDVLKFGQVHLCRSCTFLYTGLILTAGLMFLMAESFLLPIFIGLCFVVAGGSYPAWYKSWHRYVRDFLRFGLGAIIVMIPLMVYYRPWVGIVALLIMLVLSRVYSKRRKIRKAHECDGCPELSKGGICSGYKLQTSQMRAYEARATEILYGNQDEPPAILNKD